jgi:hypothetical protein
MEIWHPAVIALFCVGGLWTVSGTQRERPVLEEGSLAATVVATLEATPAREWQQPTLGSGSVLGSGTTLELMQAYLDAHQPGLAVALDAAASLQTRSDLRVRHAYARALIDQGRNGEALTVERGVLADCVAEDRDTAARSSGCDDVLLASASRRTDILQALLAFGIEDTVTYPEASLAAYQNATREARIAVE